MTKEEAVAYIEDYNWSASKMGLGRTRELLERLGNPQKDLKFVHVAGSNGKGSTCAMIESVLRAAGYKTGLYTSPYVIDFCERMQVNNRNIDGEVLAEITERVKEQAELMEDHPSQFELVTAIAMVYFKKSQCDIVVLEVGMGGELDSTNVIDAPEIAVITNIGLEHTEYLGNTLEEIAHTKGGIIKPGCSVVCYDGAPEVSAVIKHICEEKDVPLTMSDFSRIEPLESSNRFEGQPFIWDGRLSLRLPLLGEYQLHNACVALHVIEALQKRGYGIDDTAVAEGISSTKWIARFEILSSDPVFILDGGHNPQCAAALASTLERYLKDKPLTCLIGVLADKDYAQMLSEVRPYISRYICVTPNSPRALNAKDLENYLKSQGTSAVSFDTIEDAVDYIISEHFPYTVAFGSLYMAGEIRTLYTTKYHRS